MNSHFFDLNTLITTNSKVWIVDKLNPNKPILRISKSDFNLLKKGVFKKDNIKFDISGETYWISEDLMNKIKIKCKNTKTDVSNLAFSMQEFMNKDIIENNDFTIHIEHIQDLKNSSDDIYVICSKNTKKNYEMLIEKLEAKLLDIGLKIKNFYYISETFYNRDSDEINHKKVRLLLQHLIGLKTDGDKFTNEEIEKYDTISYYDDEVSAITLAKNSNEVLQFILSNTEEELRDIIKELLRNKKHKLIVNQITFNKVNNFIKTEVILQWQNLIKKFESFNHKY